MELATFVKSVLLIFLAALVEHLTPIKGYIGFTIFILVADLVTGVKAAKHRGEAVRSWGLRRTTNKFVMFSVAMLCALNFQNTFFPDFPLVFGVALFIARHEILSVFENVKVVTGLDIESYVREYLAEMVTNALKIKK